MDERAFKTLALRLPVNSVCVNQSVMRRFVFLLLAGVLITSTGTRARTQAQSPASDQRAAYDQRFFQAVQGIFDSFKSTDLRRAFQNAPAIACPDLIGDWRTAAFFNEDPNLERWFYKTFEEVQADLSRYIFQGDCKNDTSDLDVVSRFPVRESLEAYNKNQIEFDRIAYKLNAAVDAKFDSRARIYAFEMPYLYVTGRNGASSTYSMMPPNAGAKYADEVTNRWECKSVKAADNTYRFLMCRTAIVPRSRMQREGDGNRGGSAYVLLTDGREARSTFTLSFATGAPAERKDAAKMSRIAELSSENFLLRFANRSWESRIPITTILAGGRFIDNAGVDTIKEDYCEWRPQSPTTAILVDENEKNTQFYVTRSDRTASSPAAFLFDARSAANVRLGFLRCVFPDSASSANIEMKRLLSIFGDHISIEFR